MYNLNANYCDKKCLNYYSVCDIIILLDIICLIKTIQRDTFGFVTAVLFDIDKNFSGGFL